MKRTDTRTASPHTAARASYRDRVRKSVGTIPGSLIQREDTPKPVIQVIAYGPDAYTEEVQVAPEQLLRYTQEWPVTWIQVSGLGDPAVIKKIGALFHLHDLSLEDVVEGLQRPKIDVHDQYVFLIGWHAEFRERMEAHQFSIFLGSNFVITFQSQPGPLGAAVGQRIKSAQGVIRSRGADYLAYSLLDMLADSYFPVLEWYGDRLEEIENSILSRPQDDHLVDIRHIKRDLLRFRRLAWPLRDVVNSILRDDLPLFQPGTRIYLRDCYDHITQVMDLIETCRELASGLMDVYMSSVSNSMNQVMKVLTIFSTIFIPLSFVAGLYGMNFNPANSPWNMPELNWRYGYPYALLLMACIAGTLLLFYRRKGWLGGHRKKKHPPTPLI